MSADELNINYTREAFMNPINLGGLLIATLTAFFISDFGDASSVMLTTIFGLELMYLGIVPKLPRFRKKTELKKIKERHASSNEKDLFQSLDSASQKRFLVLSMNKKKSIQIFYGGFKFVKGGVNSHSISLKEELEDKFNVSLITLDNLSIFVRFLPHLVERVTNFFFLPLGFYYKGICTR